jgi:hypothetical protein
MKTKGNMSSMVKGEKTYMYGQMKTQPRLRIGIMFTWQYGVWGTPAKPIIEGTVRRALFLQPTKIYLAGHFPMQDPPNLMNEEYLSRLEVPNKAEFH